MYWVTSGHIKISKFFTSLEHMQVTVSYVYSCVTVLETAVNSKHISVYIYIYIVITCYGPVGNFTVFFQNITEQ